MAKQKELGGLCTDCHTKFLATQEEFHRPKIFYGIIVWDPPPGHKLGELLQVLKSDSTLLHDLVLHHETVGHHVGHGRFVLFDPEVKSDLSLKIESDQDHLDQRYPESLGVLDVHVGGQVIFWIDQTDAQEVDTPLVYRE